MAQIIMVYNKLYFEDLKTVSLCIPCVNQLKEKSVLITGCSGLIGSAVSDLLLYLNASFNLNIKIILAGRNIEKINDRFSYWNKDKDYFTAFYDATRNVDIEESVDYIIHAASNADPKKIGEQPVETMISNLNGTKEWLEYLKKKKNGRLLYVSSSEVYGNKPGDEPFSEDIYGELDILNPRSSYPSSKRAAETLCAAYKKEYNVDSVIVRPGHIYGPTMMESDSRASSQFPRDISSGHDINMKSKGEQKRSYCYCLDCASAIITVLLNGNSGEAYNISNSKSIVTIKEMAEAFAKAGNRKITFNLPTIHEKTNYNLMKNPSLLSEKIERLGWKACFDMDTGAKHTLEILNQSK